MIRFEHVTKSYGKNPILKDLNFEIPDGQFVVLIGPSGCGKTTTLKTINRLIDIAPAPSPSMERTSSHPTRWNCAATLVM